VNKAGTVGRLLLTDRRFSVRFACWPVEFRHRIGFENSWSGQTLIASSGVLCVLSRITVQGARLQAADQPSIGFEAELGWSWRTSSHVGT